MDEPGDARQRTIPGQTHAQEPQSANQGGQHRDAQSARARGPPPGFIRIDDVHQVDSAGVKVVLHINSVDCVAQWDGVATVQGLT
ncbi:MAG: hypothetical protein H7228_10720 [Polaromonas sp.]|nr:hypothetical protein [Polaromonas sp.]